MFRIANVYGDNMIFQIGENITVWGYSDLSEKVSVELLDECKKIVSSGDCVGRSGEWSVELPAIDRYYSSLTMNVVCKEHKISLQNVAIGEVWLLSGQSNMECTVDYCKGFEQYVENSEKYDIRFMGSETAISFEKKRELDSPFWIVVNKENVCPISGFGYIFAQELAKLMNVPIGIVKDYRSGNRINCFVSEKVLYSRKEYDEFVPELAQQKKEVTVAWSMIPTAFYNAMTPPIEVFRYKGLIWYQGESDSAFDLPDKYYNMLTDYIEMMRLELKFENLPVFIIQLPPFENEPFDYKRIRPIQFEVARADKNNYLVTAPDGGPEPGEESPIHPKNKAPVAKRCACMAYSALFDCKEEYSGPVLKKAEFIGNEVHLSFSHVGRGLQTSDGKEPTGFSVSYDGVCFEKAEAHIENNDVIINVSHAPEKVAYCYINMAEDGSLGGNLTNDTLIPASPFLEKL